jgi:hypothetical protein
MMDGVAVIRVLALAHAPLTDLVGDRIVAGDVPSEMSLPAVGLKEISRAEQDTVSREGRALVTARIQLTVHAKSYPQQKALLRAAGLGQGVKTGVIAGVAVRSVLRDAVGPDMGNSDAGIFEQPRDFKVTYIEPE